ncbi:DedA family protein [Desulfolutivibrio sp.]|uniref:DedA family protein n=1 Tax=Desulfolutivibrio sp. TaxID=2773296 RepID=UPI002F96299D
MELLATLFDFVLHVDRHLAEIVGQYGVWTYMILFCIIFLETGFVVTPFLPGDSLLFAAGALAGAQIMDPWLLNGLLVVAAISGDNTNYWIGRLVGPAVFERESRFINRKYLEKAHGFYDRHGGKTVVIARFLPIIRTFAPFVAGIARMDYRHFLACSIAGGVLWITLFTWAGYFFGNMPFVRKNFSVVILAIIVISILPGVIEFVRARRAAARERAS